MNDCYWEENYKRSIERKDCIDRESNYRMDKVKEKSIFPDDAKNFLFFEEIMLIAPFFKYKKQEIV